jgi:hypothetical protein
VRRAPDIGGRWVVDPPSNLPHEPADGQADREPAESVHDEAQARLPEGEASGHDGRQRDLVEDQGRPVVREALALDHREQAARRPEAPEDRGGRDRVGRRDDRAEDEGHLPVEPDHRVRHDGDRRHRDQHERDREQGDRAGVGAEIAQRREERRPVQQRRQEDEQHEVGRKVDLGHAWHEAEGQAAQHERDRVGHVDHARDDRQRHDGDEQPEDDQLEVLHSQDCCSG